MKVYISAAKTLQQLKEQDAPELDDSLFRTLVELDPTSDFEAGKGGKYCPWIMRQNKKGNLSEDDYNNLTDALAQFAKEYKIYPKHDINQYATVKEFLNDTETVGNRELTEKEKARMLKKQAHHASDTEKKFLVEDDEWEVWQPLTYAGSISLARQGGEKASWCTAYEGNDYHWKSYTSRGPLYIFINKKDNNIKYQLHFETNSWFDKNDNSQGMDAFNKFCSEHPVIAKFFEIESKDGIQYRAGHITGYSPDAEEIIIPETITQLPNSKFPSDVKKIYIPDSITSIPGHIFRGLTNLIDVRLPNGLTELSESLFADCLSLETLTVPDSVIKYGSRVFRSCINLKTLHNSNNLTTIGDFCFENCTSLVDVKLPDSVSVLGKNIFKGAEFDSISIPAGVDKLNKEVFADANIEDIDINNVTYVDAYAFKESSVKNIDLSKVKYIGSSAFRSCSGLTQINLNPEGVTLSPYAFADSNCKGEVTIYPTTKLNINVFENCENLTIKWEKDDEYYEFYNIACLICDEDKCPELMKANKGYTKIRTTQGKEYPVII